MGQVADPGSPARGLSVAPAEAADFAEVAALVADATREAFASPGLTAEQVAENRKWISVARETCLAAIADPARAAFVAKLDGRLAGFVLADRLDPDVPEIGWLMVAPRHHGIGVAQALMDAALGWIGPGLPVKLTVIAANARAIAFYRKYGFADAGPAPRDYAIARRLLVRPG